MKNLNSYYKKASLGCCPKEDLLDAKERLESAVEDKNAECADFEQVLQMMSFEGKDNTNPDEVKKAMESHGVAAISRDEIKVLREQRNRLAHYLTNITDALDEFKNFNKYTCFNNIRALLKSKSRCKNRNDRKGSRCPFGIYVKTGKTG